MHWISNAEQSARQGDVARVAHALSELVFHVGHRGDIAAAVWCAEVCHDTIRQYHEAFSAADRALVLNTHGILLAYADPTGRGPEALFDQALFLSRDAMAAELCLAILHFKRGYQRTKQQLAALLATPPLTRAGRDRALGQFDREMAEARASINLVLAHRLSPDFYTARALVVRAAVTTARLVTSIMLDAFRAPPCPLGVTEPSPDAVDPTEVIVDLVQSGALSEVADRALADRAFADATTALALSDRVDDDEAPPLQPGYTRALGVGYCQMARGIVGVLSADRDGTLDVLAAAAPNLIEIGDVTAGTAGFLRHLVDPVNGVTVAPPRDADALQDITEVPLNCPVSPLMPSGHRTRPTAAIWVPGLRPLLTYLRGRADLHRPPVSRRPNPCDPAAP